MNNSNDLFALLLARTKSGGGGGGGGTGTVTKVAATDGVKTASGSAITGSGTVKADLSDYTALSGDTIYNIGLNSNGNLAVKIPFDDTPTNDSTKPVTSGGVYTALGLKQPVIPDLATIRSGAEAGMTAVQPGDLGTAAEADVTDFATAAQGTKADNAIPTAEKGAAGGVAELDSNGLVLSSQLPSYVDDVLEYSSQSAFPSTGQTGKIYIAQDTNKTYRWSGSAYVEISASLALGETSSTAYRGDRGKIAYDHATDSSRLTTAQPSGLYKIATTSEGHVASVTAVAKSDITALGIPAQDTTYESKSAASGGTDVSLVTTGEKFAWNNKQSALTTAQLAAVNSGMTSEDVEQINTNKNNILTLESKNGSKNYLNYDKNILQSLNTGGSWADNVWTIGNGVTLTVNADNSITLNGTSTAGKTIYLAKNLNITSDTYILSMTTPLISKLWAGMSAVGGGEYNFTSPNSYISQNCQPNNITVYIDNGCVLDSITLYPMLCDDESWSLSHNYQQYAMSNAEITAWIKAHS